MFGHPQGATLSVPLTLTPSSAEIRREAIVVVGAFFSELEPSTLSVIAAALKTTRRAGAPSGGNVALSRVPRVPGRCGMKIK